MVMKVIEYPIAKTVVQIKAQTNVGTYPAVSQRPMVQMEQNNRKGNKAKKLLDKSSPLASKPTVPPFLKEEY